MAKGEGLPSSCLEPSRGPLRWQLPRKRRRRLSPFPQKFSSDEQLERELEAQRISEKALYVERIQAQKDERMRMYEQEKAAELADVGAVREAEEYKARVVAEARRRLLAEHAARLDGFLPKSTLNTAEERLAMQQHAEAQGY